MSRLRIAALCVAPFQDLPITSRLITHVWAASRAMAFRFGARRESELTAVRRWIVPAVKVIWIKDIGA